MIVFLFVDIIQNVMSLFVFLWLNVQAYFTGLCEAFIAFSGSCF